MIICHDCLQILTRCKINTKTWVQLSRRRLQVYPAQLTSNNVLLATNALPEWLTTAIQDCFESLKVFTGSSHGAANHVLINQYAPGEGIMPHVDGDAYFPTTATISLGSHTVLNLYRKKPDGEREDRPTWRVLQEPRSLLVTCGDAYRDLLHGIDEIATDSDLTPETIVNWKLLGHADSYVEGEKARGTRTSLTCRDVVKVSKLGNRILGRR